MTTLPLLTVIDLALVLTVVEALVLVLLSRRRALPLGAVLATLAAGAGLLLALRTVLAGHGQIAFLSCMALALAAHVIDLMLRLNGRPKD